MEATGELRDINRHRYTLEEIDEAVTAPVVRRLLKLMEFRCSYPAFDVFHLMYSNDSNVAMCCEFRCELLVDLNFKKVTVGYVDVKSRRWLKISW